MPESWYENQRKKAAERKEAQARGEYTRKVRGKASEYRDKKQAEIKKDSSFKSDGSRRVTVDSYESARNVMSQLYKGNKCDIDVGGGKIETVTIARDGMYPFTKVGYTKSGSLEIIEVDNLVAGYIF